MIEKGELLTNTLVGYVSSGSLDMNYEKLKNKPSINGVELNGNKTSKELGIEFENGLPIGGKTGEVLVKSSDNDFDSEWKEIDIPSGETTLKEMTLDEWLLNDDEGVFIVKNVGFPTLRSDAIGMTVYRNEFEEKEGLLISFRSGTLDYKIYYGTIGNKMNTFDSNPRHLSPISTGSSISSNSNNWISAYSMSQLLGITSINNAMNQLQTTDKTVYGAINELQSSIANINSILSTLTNNSSLENNNLQ